MGLDVVEREIHGARIKIHKDQTLPRHDQFDLEQTIVLKLKSGGFVKLGCLDEAASIVILPTMVLARKPSRRSARLSHNGICPMATDVVKGSNLQIFA